MIKPVPDFTIKAGDRSPSVEITCRDGNGDLVAIDGTTGRWIMRAVAGGTAVTGSLVITDDGVTPALKGTARYDWGVTDTAVPGDYYGEAEITFAGGKIGTYPNDGHLLVRITEDLD